MLCRWRLSELVAVTWGCALLASSATAGVVSPEYEHALRLYARGDRMPALAALSVMRSADVDEQVQALQRAARQGVRCPTCPDPLADLPLKAAVMLHVDLDEAGRPPAVGTEQPRACPADHARRAGQIAALLALRDPEGDFSKRFFLAMAQRCQWDFCLEAALLWGRDGLERFPRDASLLLTVGAILEQQATLLEFVDRRGSLIARTTSARVGAAQQRRERFREAEKFFTEAVASDPGLVEARVRLGHVYWRLDQGQDAQRTLEDALERGGASHLLYLAHLFLGQVHGAAGRARHATAEFRKALELSPESQAAAVALSESLLANGDGDGARQVLEAALAHSGRRTERDAHWDYLASNAAPAPSIFEELRRETLR
jgi:tetratricopeptide (TPR) repeat protein